MVVVERQRRGVDAQVLSTDGGRALLYEDEEPDGQPLSRGNRALGERRLGRPPLPC